MVAVAALLLADGRLPNGDHAHSGGMEEAVAQGLVSDLVGLGQFLIGLSSSVGVQVAALAAAACWCCEELARSDAIDALGILDAEADARMCSAAQRRTSRRRGRQLLRVARAAWPCGLLDTLGEAHHGLILGAVAAGAGLPPSAAAGCAAYGAVAVPAGAAVRLLGLDPLEVAGLLANLAPALDTVIARALSGLPTGPVGSPAWMADLPAPAAPLLDHLAEAHAQREVRLFAS
jgi:urease accessory protein